MTTRPILLTRTGGDRATAYVMSNKIVRRGDRLVCIWLDVSRHNQWAFIDSRSGTVVRSGSFGAVGVDNHCGAAMAAESDGALHVVTGGHHSAFCYYRLPPEKDTADWQQVEWIDDKATYPSLICDREGTLHLAYRSMQPDFWTLNYSRLLKGESWSAPRVLIRASKPGYIYWTNALAMGPEGRLHLVFSNARPLCDGSIYYGASHVYSDDSGNEWRQLEAGRPLELPIEASELELIENNALQAERIQSPQEIEANSRPGPLHYNYFQLLLSNPVVDDCGQPWVIVHNGLKEDAKLYHAQDNGWVVTPIDEEIKRLLPGFRIHMQSNLSRHVDGTIEAVLMVAPHDSPGWGPLDTELVRMIIRTDGHVEHAQFVNKPEPNIAHWLPSMQQWSWNAPVERPALMYTRGVNAGGFDKNNNDVNTEVCLEMA